MFHHKNVLPIYFFQSGVNLCSENIKKHIVSQLFLDDNNECSNFPLVDTENNDFKKLYQEFLNISKKTFGAFQLHSNNNETCWGVLTNKTRYFDGVHSHIKSSTINSVYYVNIPESNNKYFECGISFSWPDATIDNKKEIFYYRPKNNDLIIFPNYLKHEPMNNSSEEYRISINMEIKCNLNWPENIFKHVST